MNHVPIKLGPLALLLAVVSICLTVLAILSFTTARADLKLAEHYAQTVQTRYALEREGQHFLETARPGESRQFREDEMWLKVALDEDGQVISWVFEKEWPQDELIGGLWLLD